MRLLQWAQYLCKLSIILADINPFHAIIHFQPHLTWGHGRGDLNGVLHLLHEVIILEYQKPKVLLVIDMMYYVTTKDSDNKALITITHNSWSRRIPQLKLPSSGTYHEILFLSPLVSVHPKCCIKKLMQYNQPINMKERN